MSAKPLKCIIIDDSELDRLVIERMVLEDPRFSLAGVFSNPVESLECLASGGVDLIFLDINMPLLSGIDFLNSLPAPPVCIFITLYPEYAPDAFEANAIDYLLKPVKADRFGKAADRVIEYQAIKEKALKYDLSFEEEFLIIKEGTQINKVLHNEIIYLEALTNYTKIVTTQKKFITLHNLKNLVAKLPQDRFLRIHRSYAVAMDKIRSIAKNELLVNKETLPIGKSYRQFISERFLNSKPSLKNK
jgi:two-component system LytT family response regulator